MARIKIKSGNRVISIESDDAGVPDVTEGTGPDMIELQDDAMAEPGEENAEFNAAIDDSAVEEEDKTEAVEKANESFFDGIFGFGKKSTDKKNSTESFFDGIFGLEDGEEAAITDDGDGTTSDTDEVVTSDDSSSDEVVTDDSDGSDGEGAGEVSEGDGTTTIDTGDTVITITNSDSGDEDDDAGDDVGDEGDDSDETDSEAGGESADPDEMDNDQAIESFFQNLGL